MRTVEGPGADVGIPERDDGDAARGELASSVRVAWVTSCASSSTIRRSRRGLSEAAPAAPAGAPATTAAANWASSVESYWPGRV